MVLILILIAANAHVQTENLPCMVACWHSADAPCFVRLLTWYNRCSCQCQINTLPKNYLGKTAVNINKLHATIHDRGITLICHSSLLDELIIDELVNR